MMKIIDKEEENHFHGVKVAYVTLMEQFSLVFDSWEICFSCTSAKTRRDEILIKKTARDHMDMLK